MEKVSLARCMDIFNRKSLLSGFAATPKSMTIQIVTSEGREEFEKISRSLVSEIKAASDIDWIDRTSGCLLQSDLEENVIVTHVVDYGRIENLVTINRDRHDRLDKRRKEGKRTIIIAYRQAKHFIPSFLTYIPDLVVVGAGEQDELYSVERKRWDI